MQNSYEIIEKWVSHKSNQLKEDNIGLIIALVDNGVFPSLCVSKIMHLPLYFFTTEHGQIYFPHSKQINDIVGLSKINQRVLLCFDHVSKKNQGNVMAAQKLLTDFNADYKNLTITYDKDINVKIDYCFNLNEIEKLPKDVMPQFQNRSFI